MLRNLSQQNYKLPENSIQKVSVFYDKTKDYILKKLSFQILSYAYNQKLKVPSPSRLSSYI